jgi:hypothetical protein
MRSDEILKPLQSLLKEGEYASTFYDRLEKYLEIIEKKLKEDEELAVYYYGQGQGAEPIRIFNIGYHNPYLMILHGKDPQSQDCTVLLHTHSVQLILKIEQIKKKSKRRTIGFVGSESPSDDPKKSLNK